MIKNTVVCDMCGKEIGAVDTWNRNYYGITTGRLDYHVNMSTKHIDGNNLHLCSAICLRQKVDMYLVDLCENVKAQVEYVVENDQIDEQEMWDTNILVTTGINGVDKLDTQTI